LQRGGFRQLFLFLSSDFLFLVCSHTGHTQNILPIPEKVTDPSGNVLFTGEDINNGQQVFLRNGLMQYGSVLGHGAYLGPDYTTDYLRRSAIIVSEYYGGEGSDQSGKLTVEDFKTNVMILQQKPWSSLNLRQWHSPNLTGIMEIIFQRKPQSMDCGLKQ
jgi:nitric oxide reductase large subunit